MRDLAALSNFLFNNLDLKKLLFLVPSALSNSLILGLSMIKQSNGQFSEIIGDYSPGYLYGTVKVHKSDPRSIRPIISQITTPTYKIAKNLDNLIKKYMPCKFMLNSRNEFLDILKNKKCE